MTVIFYDHGEHGAGFVGFRVARTIGTNTKYKQKYFSLKQYSYGEAAKLAYALDEKWEKEANEVKHITKLGPSKRSSGPHIIADGIRAMIGIENKIRDGIKKTYFAPSFSVKIVGYGKGEIAFRPYTHGYEKAFELAVTKFSEIHGLTDTERLELLNKIPDKSVFTELLFERLRKNGHQVALSDIEIKLAKS